MKYDIKIIPHEGGYVGYALLNDEVVYASNIHKDTIMASREVSNYIANTAKINPVPSRRPNSAIKTPPAPIRGSSPMQAAPTKCCGRN